MTPRNFSAVPSFDSLSVSVSTPLVAQLEVKVLAQRIHAALPQTQCTRCGYPDCMAYAEAIASGEAAINQCPPGGAEGVARLAAITDQEALPLNPANGFEAPRSVAVIDEAWCIGCTLCLPACPTDAILGSNKMMHTVIEPHCTGCELCIAVCPVDCISLENVSGEKSGWAAWSQRDADAALVRYDFHSFSRPNLKLVKVKTLQPGEPGRISQTGHTEHAETAAAQTKRDVIAQALAKSRAARPGK